MELEKRIREDIKTSMKNKTPELTTLLRVVIGEFETAKGRPVPPYSEAVALGIVKKMHTNAIDLNNSFEAEVLEKYIPKMLEPKEIKIIVKNIIDVNGFNSIGQMGQVMGKIKECAESSLIDMKAASTFVRELLQ
jgi:uncharacterized protein YqeY